jgi:hypothetical protein
MMITDREEIKDRIEHGDFSFAERTVLAVLARGEGEVLTTILDELKEEHFTLPLMDILFDWIAETIRSGATVTEPMLQERMKGYVRSHWPERRGLGSGEDEWTADEVLPGYLAVIDHIFEIDYPEEQTVQEAIGLLLRRRARRDKHIKKQEGL